MLQRRRINKLAGMSPIPIRIVELGSGVGVRLRVPENGVGIIRFLSNWATVVPLNIDE